MPKFDIIIPVGPNDIKFIPRVVKYVSICLQDVDHIYIISANKNFKSIKNYVILKHPNCVMIDEDKLLHNLSFNTVDNLLKKYSPNKKQRTGWYFQQFLKFAFAQSEYAQSYYL